MYESFIRNCKREKEREFNGLDLLGLNSDMVNFFEECGGCSFKSGLYRTYLPDSCRHWAINITNYFPKYKSRIIPFGYDWMGRQFAIDISRENYLLMFDPSTGEDFELKDNILSFHINELANDQDNLLSEEVFREIVNRFGLNKLKYNDCAGYKTPLFLGGIDDLSNYEISDVEVYWDIQCQIFLKIKDLPPGTKINSINFK